MIATTFHTLMCFLFLNLLDKKLDFRIINLDNFKEAILKPEKNMVL